MNALISKRRDLEVAGDDEPSLLPAGHVEPELLLGRAGEELPRQPRHILHELWVDPVVHHLEYPPVLARLHDPPADLGPAGAGLVVVVDPLEGDHRDLVAELVVGNLGPLVLIPDEAGLQGRLLRQRGQGGGRGRHRRLASAGYRCGLLMCLSEW